MGKHVEKKIILYNLPTEIQSQINTITNKSNILKDNSNNIYNIWQEEY